MIIFDCDGVIGFVGADMILCSMEDFQDAISKAEGIIQ